MERPVYNAVGETSAWEAADRRAARAIAEAFAAAAAPIAVGLSGAQGSGKTTMAARVVDRLGRVGLRAAILSLDDFYLTRSERSELGRTVHPLLATRGVPGTHDIGPLAAALDALLADRPAAVPIFDKGLDDRAGWRTIEGVPDVILLEGWCVGAQPEPKQRLATPVNALEREEDADATWRAWVNHRLATDYAELFARLSLRILLRAPDFGVVLRWRTEQERDLLFGGMGTLQMKRFIDHYERITRWMLEDEPADLVFRLDASRKPLV